MHYPPFLCKVGRLVKNSEWVCEPGSCQNPQSGHG
jgi:hypothetical protein